MEEEKSNNSLRTAAGCVSIALFGIILLSVGIFLLAVIVFPGTTRGADLAWTVGGLIGVMVFLIYLIMNIFTSFDADNNQHDHSPDSLKRIKLYTLLILTFLMSIWIYYIFRRMSAT